MKKQAKITLALSLAFLGALSTPALGAASSYQAPKTFLRTDFFKDIVGMDEKTFRHKYGWNEKTGVLDNLPPKAWDSWIKENPRRKAILSGWFEVFSVKDLKNKPYPKATKPAHFKINFYDPAQSELSDIGYLQANPTNKNAAFQIASTFFGPLEGGIFPTSAYITGMLKSPVQGEEASISAAGATIFRKYFMPTIHANKKLPKRYDLLYNFKGFVTNWHSNPHVDLNKVANYTYNPADSDKVMLGIHRDVLITGGDHQGTIQKRLGISQNQRVNQIFTSAYSMNNALKQKKVTSGVESFAKMVLNASYKGTIDAARAIKAPTLYLTLMGGGAFRNKIEWIDFAIKRIKQDIKASGMDVILLYRPDKVRKQNKVRNAKDDITFLNNMLQLADEINGTNHAKSKEVQDLVKRYVTAGYDYNANPNDQLLYAIYSSAAQELNKLK